MPADASKPRDEKSYFTVSEAGQRTYEFAPAPATKQSVHFVNEYGNHEVIRIDENGTVTFPQGIDAAQKWADETSNVYAPIARAILKYEATLREATR